MEKQGWRIVAVIFIVLFLVESALIIWGWILIAKDNEQYKECNYNICDGESYGYVEDGVCKCVGEDVLGNAIITKYKIMD